MNPRVAFPFLTLSEAALNASPWQISLNGGEWFSPDEFVPDWDASSILRLEREIVIDRKITSADLRIPEAELSFSLGVRAGTGQGRLPRLVTDERYVPIGGDVWRAKLTLQLAGSQLSAVIDLLTEVILTVPPHNAPALAPNRVGDRLWHDRYRFRLEGDEPRFPLEVADIRTFVGSSVAAAAPWFLHWSSQDWSRDFHGAIRLYLNYEYPEFVARVEQQDLPTLQALLGDVIGQICERFVADTDAQSMLVTAEAGTLGAQAAAWLRLAWPNKDVVFIRSVLENRPGMFRAAMLALAEQSEN